MQALGCRAEIPEPASALMCAKAPPCLIDTESGPYGAALGVPEQMQAQMQAQMQVQVQAQI